MREDRYDLYLYLSILEERSITIHASRITFHSSFFEPIFKQIARLPAQQLFGFLGAKDTVR